MAGESASDRVVLGLGTAAWAYALTDQTSPAVAARAGALTDTSLPGRVTELRVHGVSGSDGPTMLEHPTALQVAGDTTAGFYRRWSPGSTPNPSVSWKLEAYSWGGLTEQPLAAAAWLLLAPFMMYNVAHFMLPPEPPANEAARPPGHDTPVAPDPASAVTRRPRRGHQAAAAVLRLLALAATVQFITGVAVAIVSTVAWQAASHPGALPDWMSWYTHLSAGWRVAIATLACAAVVMSLWLVSVRTANRYEARSPSLVRAKPSAWPLTEPGFWQGYLQVRRHRSLHAAAALAAVALLVSLPATDPAWPRPLLLAFSALVLAGAAVAIASPSSDRHRVTIATGGPPTGAPAGWWCHSLLAAGVTAVVGTAVARGLASPGGGPEHRLFPGSGGFLMVLLGAEVALLALFGAVVAAQARRAPPAGDGYRPYLRGHLATLMASLAFLLGGLLTAAANLGLAGVLGAAVPGGLRVPASAAGALFVPWPVYAFGAAALGMALGAGVALVPLCLRYRRNWRNFASLPIGGPADGGAQAGKPADGGTASGGSAGGDLAGAAPVVSGDYPNGHDPGTTGQRRRVAKAWAGGLVADDAALALALLAAGGLLVTLTAEAAALVLAARSSPLGLTAGFLHLLAAAVSLLTTALAAWLVGMLRAAYTAPSRRKTIGAVWDVGTFWPRAAHPFAPPCYAERAVPELVDRVRLLLGPIAPGEATAGQQALADECGLTVPCGPVLLTGYSQGSVIVPAVAAQLPDEVLRGPDFALLTLACPARRLYARAFPAYFGQQHLAELRARLSDGGPQRWRNGVRRTDYIGSWIFAPPPAARAPGDPARDIDQLYWDPAALSPDAEPTPPPIHRHSGFWADPRTQALGSYLMNLLERTPGGAPGPAAEGEDALRASATTAEAPRLAAPRPRGANLEV